MSEERSITTSRRWMRRLRGPLVASLAANAGAARALRVVLGVTSTVAIGGGAAMGCLDRPIEVVEPRTTSTVVDVLTQSSVDKIDVLLVIDNSGSMADKQEILATAVPKLVERLVTPACVNPEDGSFGNPSVGGTCEDGFEPEFRPIKDINIGIVSSSLGSAGQPACNPVDGRNNQDNGQLLWRTTPGTANNDAPTYKGLGFLAWDPDLKRDCPGQEPGSNDPGEGNECAGSSDGGALIATLTTMVQGVGEFGCGFEATMESAYRFLADPKPWQTFASPGIPDGEDTTILDQRKAFLRPDSLLAIIMLTDENDCSIRADTVGQLTAIADGERMPRPRSECADDPGDACCVSCIEPPPDGCDGDGGCAEPGNQSNLANFYEGTDRESLIDTRCSDQKRRFGIDLLYPTDRYVNAFSQQRINPNKLDLAAGADGGEANPIFSDLQDLGRTVRRPDLVFVAGIVGVPWQLIARKNADGDPDLLGGVNTFLADGLPVGGFQSYDELQQNDVWKELIPLDPADFADNPLMIESRTARSGLSTDLGSNDINGNEWDTRDKDLQYSCIFDLPETAKKECTEVAGNCDCKDPRDNPLCDPGVGTNPTDDPGEDPNQPNTFQARAKAYPGTRILQVLNGLRNQGIPASICPAQVDEDNQDAKDYGYTPAVFAIIDRLKTKLGGSCQPRQLVADSEGNTPCIVIEARDSDSDKNPETTRSCDKACTGEGRAPIGDKTKAAADKIQADLDGEEPEPGFDCLCEIVQLQGDPKKEGSDRNLCQNQETPKGDVDGWCYVDATTVPPVGNPDLVSACPPTEQRLVRFVNQGEVSQGGRLYITCAGDAAAGQ